jgi:hypothetical protein
MGTCCKARQNRTIMIVLRTLDLVGITIEYNHMRSSMLRAFFHNSVVTIPLQAAIVIVASRGVAVTQVVNRVIAAHVAGGASVPSSWAAAQPNRHTHLPWMRVLCQPPSSVLELAMIR